MLTFLTIVLAVGIYLVCLALPFAMAHIVTVILHPFIIRHRDGRPYLVRWHLFRSRWFNVYIHKFGSSDGDRDLHGHHWWFTSLILWRGYYETTSIETKKQYIGTALEELLRLRKFPGMLLFRPARHKHKVELLQDKNGKELPAWTLVITGQKEREWGFHMPEGWVHNRKYLDTKYGPGNYEVAE